VDSAALDKAAWATHGANRWSSDLYVFGGEWRSGARLYARCFVPGAGVDEDPATGSACAGLVASLAERSPGGLEACELWIDQGVRMGRPSVLYAEARSEHGRLTEVDVSGFVTIVGAGVITTRDL
jgi:trans-2,3-dihydro-3-hydroxyanthranilate isomerase